MENNTYAGIDFSINSTSICIEENGIEYVYVFPKNRNAKSKAFTVSLYNEISEMKGNITVVDYSFSKIEDYTKNEIQHIISANDLANGILDVLLKYDNPKIAIEGFSYDSIGRSFIDMIVYNTIMRNAVFTNFSDIIVVPPSNVKKFASGNGNANKEKMIGSYLDRNLNTDLFKLVEQKYNPAKIQKPIDDMVDSYFLKEYAKNEYEKKGL